MNRSPRTVILSSLIFLFFIAFLVQLCSSSPLSSTNKAHKTAFVLKEEEEKKTNENGEKQPWTPTAIQAVPALSQPIISPDQKYAVYTVTVWDTTDNVTTSNLELLNLETNKTSTLTYQKGARDNSPTWSPTGDAVAFLSTRNGSKTTQIFLVYLNDPSLTVSKFTNYPLSVSELDWSITGVLSLTFSIYLDCANEADPLGCTYSRDQDISQSAENGYLYEQLYVRYSSTWGNDKVKHIFILRPIQVQSSSGVDQWALTSQPIDIMPDLNANAPPPYYTIDSYAFSPDGKSLAFMAQPVAHNMAWHTNYDIYIVDISSLSSVTTMMTSSSSSSKALKLPPPVCITTDSDTLISVLEFSHSGRFLAFLSTQVTDDWGDRYQIFIYNLQTQQKTAIASTWDRSPSKLAWSEDDQFLLVVADDQGARNLYAISLASQVYQLTNHGTISSFSVFNSTFNTNQNLLLLQSTYTSAGEMWSLSFAVNSFKLSFVDQSKLTDYTSQYTSNYAMTGFDKFYFESTNSSLIQGYFFKPLGLDPSKKDQKWPLVLLIHGGPQGAWSDQWGTYYNPQMFTSHGYAVLLINPRCSTGFGAIFQEACYQQWGGNPYYDLIKGVDYVLQQYPYIDPNRLGAIGHSYGGYMINWFLGQKESIERFRCFVTHAGIFDTEEFAYSTDIVGVMYSNFGGLPYDVPLHYKRWSPHRFVSFWQTPTMVVHGGQDYRVPINEGISVFSSLQRKQIPSQFFYLPDEPHNINDPRNNVAMYELEMSWLDTWTNGSSSSSSHHQYQTMNHQVEVKELRSERRSGKVKVFVSEEKERESVRQRKGMMMIPRRPRRTH